MRRNPTTVTWLSRLRDAPQWCVLLVGVVALVVTTTALLPHDDGGGEDFDCLVCKAGQKPLTELTAHVSGEPPVVFAAAVPSYHPPVASEATIDTGSPRAPPA